MFSNYKRINSNKYNKQNWIREKRAKVISTGWKDQPVPKGLPPCVSVAASLFQPVPMVPKAPGYPSQWSRLRGTGWETGTLGPSQQVLMACFLVVLGFLSQTEYIFHS